MKNLNLPVVGILGGGQLATMMAQAYQQLGGNVAVFSEDKDCPAFAVANDHMVGDSSELADLRAFFNTVDLVTLENEFTDSQLLLDAMQETGTKVYPDPHHYRQIEDKLSENQFFTDLDLPTAEYFVVNSVSDLIDAPGYLKVTKGGYDGIGTLRVENIEQATTAFNVFSKCSTVIFEREIKFVKELSLIAVANSNNLVFYPLVETHQDNATCRYVSYPSGVSKEIEASAQVMIEKIMCALDTRGLFAFELFLTEEGDLLINESAPRPHNSGHITLDMVDCSQFENHMRAVVDMPLISPRVLKDHALMVNLLGTRNGVFDPKKVLSFIDDSELAVTFYGKRQSRINRKMGHINLWGNDTWERAENLVLDLEI